MKFSLPLIIIVFLLTWSFGSAAQGSSSSASNSNKSSQQNNKQVRVKSANQAAQMAKGRYGGKVLKVQSNKSGYKVKLIKNNGNIISVFVNAKSGTVSGQ